MVHTFHMKDRYIALDVNSGCVHVLDKLCYDVIEGLNKAEKTPDDVTFSWVLDQFHDAYREKDLEEAWEDICELYQKEQLFSKDDYIDIAGNMKRNSPVKALCLHVAHDCNLRCAYCFADEGAYHKRRELMSAETGKRAMDFLIAQSKGRRNLEVDFFGGEPLMNFNVVKEVVQYAREQEKIHDKNFRFTITTNGVLLNDENIDFINREMSNVVLSLDGRKETNDRVRCRIDGSGSYDSIVPKLIRVAESRNQDRYYVRGTFTRYNLDFADDVLHLADLGFKQTSVEPVVSEPDAPYALREEDLPKIYAEYEKLVDA